MPHVRISHITEYTYHRPVRPTLHRLMLRPRDSHDLRLGSATLAVTPPPSRTRWAHDVFGNSVCYLEWDQALTRLLRIVSVLELDHFPTPHDLPLAPVANTYPFAYSAGEAPDLALLQEQQYADPHGIVAGWARGFLNPAGPTGTMDLLIAITRAIRSGFTYASRDAEGTHPPLHTLAARSGACRDFALLMMEACRSLGLAAQFVSGYLYDEASMHDEAGTGGRQGVVGGGATHAWCAIYLPGAGWVEFDPTNGLVAGRNLVRVCAARAPEQAVPVRGAYIGTATDFDRLRVAVDVSVGGRTGLAA